MLASLKKGLGWCATFLASQQKDRHAVKPYLDHSFLSSGAGHGVMGRSRPPP